MSTSVSTSIITSSSTSTSASTSISTSITLCPVLPSAPEMIRKPEPGSHWMCCPTPTNTISLSCSSRTNTTFPLPMASPTTVGALVVMLRKMP